MPVKIKEKSDLEKLHDFLRKKFGSLPSPRELNLYIGGDPADWGRILRGQQKIKGEYYARLKRIKDSGLKNATLELCTAMRSRRYGGRTRKGRIVLHAKSVIKDMYNFNLEKITQEKMEEKIKSGMGFADEYDQYIQYMEIGQKLNMYGHQYPEDCFKEHTLRREFINSLS
ncbi:MAG: hypothetical protein LBH35_07725 [Treponema sp.]|jgi:hypothetical protein|nr:hypothetical protein [Treponema sp.]